MNFRQIIPTFALLGAVSLSMAASERASAQLAAKAGRTAKPVRVTSPVAPVTNDSGTSGTTAATVPVGFTQTTVTPATDANTPSSQVLSVPFYNAAAYAAAVSTVDSSTQFSNSSATWTTNQFAQAGAPYLVHFRTGNSVGRYFLIQSNTATQLTVFNRGYNLTATIAAADTFEIVPANTLGSLFGTTTVPFLQGATAQDGDNLYLWNGSSFSIYYNDSTSWRLSGSFLNQNNTVLYPDEGIFLLRRGTTSLTLTFVGTVPSTTERSDVPGPGSTFVSNRFPTDTTLGSLGLQNLPGWISGTDTTAVDTVYVWSGTTWLVYYYDGSNWARGGSFLKFDTLPIPTGSAVFVNRKSAASGTAGTLAQTLPYSL